MRQRVAMAIVALLAAGLLTSCQIGRAGGRCKAGTVAQDTTHVLTCKQGRWVRLISKADGMRQLARIQAEQAAAAAAAAAPPQVAEPPAEPPVTEPPVTAAPPTVAPPTAPPTTAPPVFSPQYSWLLAEFEPAGCSACTFEMVASESGTRVAFVTTRGLDPADTDGQRDVYLIDSAAGTTAWITRSAGAGLNSDGFLGLSMDDAGTGVTFVTSSSDLGPVDGNGQLDAYFYDVAAGSIALVGGSTGADRSAVSRNGRYLAFGPMNDEDIVVFDRSNAAVTTLTLDLGINFASSLTVSDDGRRVGGGAAFVAPDGIGSGDNYFFNHSTSDGTALLLAGGSDIGSVVSTADGTELASTAAGNGSAQVWDVTTDGVDVISGCFTGNRCVVGNTLDISPDGRRVAFVGYAPFDDRWAVVADRATGESVPIVRATGVRLTAHGVVLILQNPDAPGGGPGLARYAPMF